MASEEDDDRTIIRLRKVESVRPTEAYAVLELVKGPGAPREYSLSLPVTMIGRDRSVDICVASQEMSRRHLRIERVGEEFLCTDNDSVNGVFVNGVKIHSAELRDGDQLQLADVVFRFHSKS